MLTQQQSKRHTRAADELRERWPSLEATHAVDSLCIGLTHLRNLLIARIHEDVERHFGVDTMIAPISEHEEEKQTQKAKAEIEIYSAIVCDDEVSRCGFVGSRDDWFLDWLFALRLGERHHIDLEKHVDFYRSETVDERRLKFLSVLHRIIPESSKAPLVLFRLYPRAVRIATAVAFGDPLRAQEVRAEQLSFLPAISECYECHGRVLDNEEICRGCGNPVWKFKWLQAD